LTAGSAVASGRVDAEIAEPPRSIGAGAPQEREELLAAPVRGGRPSVLDLPLTELAGAGPKLAEAAAEAGIETVGDVLQRVPHSYRDRAGLRRLDELLLGEEATVLAEVRDVRCAPRAAAG
jgi:hypothetical protein